MGKCIPASVEFILGSSSPQLERHTSYRRRHLDSAADAHGGTEAPWYDRTLHIQPIGP